MLSLVRPAFLPVDQLPFLHTGAVLCVSLTVSLACSSPALTLFPVWDALPTCSLLTESLPAHDAQKTLFSPHCPGGGPFGLPLNSVYS